MAIANALEDVTQKNVTSRNMEDELLLWKRFMAGDNHALGELYSILFEPLVFISYFYVRNNEIARDIVSELFVTVLSVPVHERNSKWGTIKGVKAYLSVAVRNKSIDYFRSNTNQLAIAKDVFTSEASEMHVFPLEELEKLPSTELELFQMHLAGYKNEEIAQHIGISEKTVRNKLSLIRKKLAKNIRFILSILVCIQV
jgi:RNA polymerase sigma factor (sigma-70 family)